MTFAEANAVEWIILDAFAGAREAMPTTNTARIHEWSLPERRAVAVDIRFYSWTALIVLVGGFDMHYSARELLSGLVGEPLCHGATITLTTPACRCRGTRLTIRLPSKWSTASSKLSPKAIGNCLRPKLDFVQFYPSETTPHREPCA